MKAVFLILAFAVNACNSLAQQTWGTIAFKNLGIQKADGSGFYNVPIYMDPINPAAGGSATVGAGLLAGGVTAGLFQVGSSMPLATSKLGTTTAQSPFLVNPALQTVSVPGVLPGETTTLVIRAWQGESFEFARASGASWGEWTVQTKPLGGVLPGGGVTNTPPTLTGWGSESGIGLTLDISWPARVFSSIDSPQDGAIFTSPATVNVLPKLFVFGYPTVTNYSVFLNSTLVKSQVPTNGSTINLSVGPIRAGNYSLVFVVDGLWGLSSTSAPINIKVVEPVTIAVSSPRIQEGQFAFQYTANLGLQYLIESSPDLKTWQPILTNTPSSSPAQFSDGYSAESQRFYRINRFPNP